MVKYTIILQDIMKSYYEKYGNIIYYNIILMKVAFPKAYLYFSPYISSDFPPRFHPVFPPPVPPSSPLRAPNYRATRKTPRPVLSPPDTKLRGCASEPEGNP